MTGFDSPLTAPETDFLSEVVRHAGKLFLVVNKRDLVTSQDAGDVLDFVRQRLRDDLGIGQPRMFSVSALQALQAPGQDGGQLIRSGVPDLHAELRGFLTADKTRLFLGNIAGRAASLVAAQQRDLVTGRLAAGGGLDLRQVLAAFEARTAALDQERNTVTSRITGRIGARLPGLLSARAAAWRADLRELLSLSAGAAVTEALTADGAHARARDPQEAVRDYLERAGRELTASWLERRAGEVLEMLITLAADEISALVRLAQAAGAVGAELAGLDSGHDRSEPAGWSAEDLPPLTVREPKWAAQRGRHQHSRRNAALDIAQIRDLVNAAIRAAADEFAGHLLAAFPRAALDWAVRLDEQVAVQMRQRADWFRNCLKTAPAEEDLTAADGLVARSATIQATLDAPAPAAQADTVPVTTAMPDADAPAAAGDCAVCERLQETLTSCLFGGQLRLATREDEQERHAARGGFCPLHTWQYAAASPVGIASAYAKVAAAVADALDGLAAAGIPAADLSSRIAALTARAGRCPVCAALANRERVAIAEIVSSPQPEPAPVCLRHLALVVAAGADSRTWQALLRSLAATLHRDSQDMRTYALKREAYQSRLVTEEESRAHLDVLRRLAGRPALCRPWTDQGSARM